MRQARLTARLRVLVRPPGNDHRHALRVAIGLVVPGLILLTAQRPDLIIYAVFGSFVGRYGRGETRRRRLVHQAQASAVVLTGAGIGVLLSSVEARPWILVVTAVGFATVGSLVTDGMRLGPEGPFFGIFALGALATIPAGRVAPWAALSICAGTALFCMVVSFVSAVRSDVDEPAAVRMPGPSSLLHAARYAMAITVAGSAGLLLGVDHANWAMAAAAVPLAAADGRSHAVHPVVHRGIHRVVGTLAGLGVTALLLLPHLGPTALAILVIALMFPTELFLTRHYGLALGFFTPLIMLMTELAAPAEPLTLIRDRAIDTLIGVTSGVAAAVVIRRRYVGPR